MNDLRVYRILKLVRNFFFSSVNREFLIFLFFFALSGTFWLLMTLNESYEREMEISFRVVDIPKNVVLTSDTVTNIKVTIRDKGYSLMTYLYGDKLHQVKINFKNYARKSGCGIVPLAEMQKLIYNQLFSSSRIVSIKPDKYEFFFNYGLCKKVPVRLQGRILPGQSYYLSKISFNPDSVIIYAQKNILDSIKEVYTRRLHIYNLIDTLNENIQLEKIKAVKYVPASVHVSVYPDILTEEGFDVPITAINMPTGKILRTFPSRVRVSFIVGASMFRTIHPESFKVVVDYNELIAHPAEKCNLYLRSVPHGVRNAHIGVNQVDYLIEEQ